MLIGFTLSAQMNEAEVKSMINTTEEPKLVLECSRFLQENFFHFADLVADKLLSFQPKKWKLQLPKGIYLTQYE